MKDIIADAQAKRFKISDDDSKKQGIAITEGFYYELMKHPYHSSKSLQIIFFRETGHRHLLNEREGKTR